MIRPVHCEPNSVIPRMSLAPDYAMQLAAPLRMSIRAWINYWAVRNDCDPFIHVFFVIIIIINIIIISNYY